MHLTSKGPSAVRTYFTALAFDFLGGETLSGLLVGERGLFTPVDSSPDRVFRLLVPVEVSRGLVSLRRSGAGRVGTGAIASGLTSMSRD